jgi:hypothetical protein
MKKIFIVSFSPLHRDPRVKRQVRALRADYHITCAGYTDINEEGVACWQLKLPKTTLFRKLRAGVLLIGRLYTKYYWQRREVVSLLAAWSAHGKAGYDLVIANDIESLPVALLVAEGCPVLLDAHEYSPGQSSRWSWRLLTSSYVDWLCRTYLGQAKAMTTVGPGLAQAYAENYGIKASVVYNAPDYHDISPVPAAVGHTIRLVHHGGAHQQRGLEEIIDLLGYLDDKYTLDLYLVAPHRDSEKYLGELRNYARKFGERITFREPVDMDDLPRVLNRYDIGIVLIQPTNFNYAHCLPNKFFEYVQARTMIATGPTPDMKMLVEKYGLGIVSNDFTAKSLAGRIAACSLDDINRVKQQVDAAAEVLNNRSGAMALLGKVSELLRVPKNKGKALYPGKML